MLYFLMIFLQIIFILYFFGEKSRINFFLEYQSLLLSNSTIYYQVLGFLVRYLEYDTYLALCFFLQNNTSFYAMPLSFSELHVHRILCFNFDLMLKKDNYIK